MNIKKFKQGDIITRIAPCEYDHNGIKDSSYCGDRIIFLGTQSNIIFFNIPESHFRDEVQTVSFARDGWDEGWDYFPEKLWQKALIFVKKLLA